MSKADQERQAVSLFTQSPLHHLLGQTSSNKDKGLVIKEAPLKGHLILRGRPDDRSFISGVEGVLNLRLPTEPRTYEAEGATVVYWLAPTEWLLVVEGNTQILVESQLREVLQGHFSIVDVSGGQTIINLSGEGVEAVMKKSCVYDFHYSNFDVGRCVQTVFAKATAIVSKQTDGSFDLVIRRSFAGYLAKWLLDASSEYVGLV